MQYSRDVEGYPQHIPASPPGGLQHGQHADASMPQTQPDPMNHQTPYQNMEYGAQRIIVYQPQDYNSHQQQFGPTGLHHGQYQQDTQRADSETPPSESVVPTKEPFRHPREGWPAWQWPAIQVVFVSVMMLMGYDVSNIANIQAPIYHAFGHIELLPWVAVGYSSLVTAFIPLFNRLSSLFPLKWLWCAGQILAFLGCAISGAATNFDMLIIGRVLLGIGGAGIIGLGPLCNVHLSTPAEYPRYQGLAGMAFSTGLVLGPIIGSAFEENENATWRWAIYINLPILGLTFFLSLLAIPSFHLVPQAATMSASSRLRTVDWTGMILHVTTVVLLCIVIVFSGSTWAWNSGPAIACWVLLGVVSITYAAQQGLGIFIPGPIRRHRLLAIHIPSYHRAILPVLVASFASVSGYGIPMYYTPLFFAFARGLGPLEAAVRLLPFLGTLVVAIILGAGSLPKVRFFAPQYIFGGACIAAGSVAQAYVTPETSEPRVMGISALIGFGTGLIFQLGPGVLSQLVTKYKPNDGEDAGQTRRDTAGLFYVFQLGGIAILLSLAGCVFQNVGFLSLQEAFGSVPGTAFTDQEIHEALAGLDSPIWTNQNLQSQEIILLAVDAVTRALARVYWIPFAGGLTCMICGLLMGFEKLDFDTGAAGDAEKGRPGHEMAARPRP